MRRHAVILAGLVLLTAGAGCGGSPEGTATSTAQSQPSVPTSLPPVVTSGAPTTSASPSTTVAPTLVDPPAFDRWTTILESLPVDEWDEEQARSRAFELASMDTGVLLSSDYPSLNPGYWVVFSGDFASRDEAIAHCRALEGEGSACYHRYLGEAPTVVAGREAGTLVAWVGGGLAIVDAATGQVDAVVSSAYQEAVFPGPVELTPDGTGVYFSVGFEDYWFSCEASAGRIDHVDLTTGEVTEVRETGLGPRISPDGSRLAYIASTHCNEPENGLEVESFADTVAVLDLATGAVHTWGPSPGAAATVESLISSIAWGSDSTTIYAAMEAGPLLAVDTGVGTSLDAFPEVGPGRVAVGFGAWILEGIDAGSGFLVAAEWDYATSTTRIVEINPTTGRVVEASEPIPGLVVVRLDQGRTARLVSGGGLITGAPAEPIDGEGADW
jgi:hypothetical protein